MNLVFHEGMSHPSVLELEVQVFPKGCSDHDLKMFRLTEYNKVL